MSAREGEDILTLVNLLRSGLVRNLGNITSTKLFTHAYAGTKLLIDDYITQVALSIQYVASLQPAPMQTSGFTSQAKLELLHDTRQAFGRTTLLLQGGSAFGLCHLGVVKALHLQGLLPRIITGTATGAMIAALVGIHPESELLALLEGETIDLSAFDQRRKEHAEESWMSTFMRRMKRLLRKGHLYDMELLEECVRANVGDLTFEEAYARSKRILNITIATAGKTGTPNLLNYLTAPNVVCSTFHPCIDLRLPCLKQEEAHGLTLLKSLSGPPLRLPTPHPPLHSLHQSQSTAKTKPAPSSPGHTQRKPYSIPGDTSPTATANPLSPVSPNSSTSTTSLSPKPAPT